ncbi:MULTISPECIES: type IV toxin-antitoxin system AbiEi family antitoxin domain-containing protein [Gordonibacter]|uniref:Abortive phage infection protein n=1 Tax=Gordonibacter faecis TaxID=3047475 RepID=A0ABT7DL90_9ACTN|nr:MULTISPECIES: hypothetical protein [unclassified Gordonibacter]MDJ1650301.1 hypothetical protein [Gordonibacter sp. KGMB12511]HIW76853.1 hypothetical protein [Candidatus Gordonibacter avicola]
MKPSVEQRIEDILRGNGGVLVASEVIEQGVPRNAVYQFVKDRGLEKVSPGIFLDENEFPDELYLLQARYPKVVYSHNTALYLHDMAERESVPITLTVDSGYNVGSLADSGARIFYVKPEWYGIGVCDMESPGGHAVRVYDRERTLIDIIRRKAALDPAAYAYALKRYAASREKNPARLGHYAQKMGVEAQVQRAMEVLL